VSCASIIAESAGATADVEEFQKLYIPSTVKPIHPWRQGWRPSSILAAYAARDNDHTLTRQSPDCRGLLVLPLLKARIVFISLWRMKQVRGDSYQTPFQPQLLTLYIDEGGFVLRTCVWWALLVDLSWNDSECDRATEICSLWDFESCDEILQIGYDNNARSILETLSGIFVCSCQKKIDFFGNSLE